MEQKSVEAIENSATFKELVSKRSKFSWTLAVVMLVVYYAFILTIAFSPATLGVKMGEGVTTIGIPIGIAVIVISFLLTGVYVRRANSEFDAMTKQIKEELKEQK